MSFLDELRRFAKPFDEDDFYDEDDLYTDEDSPAPREEEPVSRPAPRPISRPAETPADSALFSERAAGAKKDNKVVNIHTTTAVQVVLSRPERFEQAAEIADHLGEKRTVVMNLETTNKDVARRLVDFLSGVAYANGGKIKKVAINTYIITPYNVDIMGDLIDELENNGVYI